MKILFQISRYLLRRLLKQLGKLETWERKISRDILRRNLDHRGNFFQRKVDILR